MVGSRKGLFILSSTFGGAEAVSQKNEDSAFLVTIILWSWRLQVYYGIVQ